MIKISRILLALTLLFSHNNLSAQKKASTIKYESVSRDPLNVRIYTLKNGLKVYMSVYKDAPRIQTLIAVKAGSKNDPSDATGLAHYLEHMLFKGTDKYGALDYDKEKAELNKIETLYETYRKTSDPNKRKVIYHQIDSISGVAAKFAIANEYDKMTAAIGCKGTNAFTSFEQTVYINDVPSNQLENWLNIEAERFRSPVMRIFHTELEAVYEEKNISLDRDDEKVWDGLLSGLFKKHAYGTQTTIGTIEHLKNPSILEIKKYYNANYVPNNMAIILSGDFDPDKTIQMIEEKFGYMNSKPVEEYKFQKEDEILAPIEKTVFGPEAESVSLGFRLGGVNTSDPDMLQVVAKILFNGKAGLIDLNLNKKQMVISSSVNEMILKDYSCLFLDGYPKEGQTLEQVRDLLLGQIEELKKGNFPDWIITAVVNQIKLERIQKLSSNYGRAGEMMDAFVNDIEWKKKSEELKRLSTITKKQVTEFAKKYFNNNYVLVYKRSGEDANVQKVEKPEITPVEVNRDKESSFLKKITGTRPQPIEPSFADYDKDILKSKLKNGCEVNYNKNMEDGTFRLFYVYDLGRATYPLWPIAIEYLKYLGTSKLNAEQVAQEFYKIGCSFNVFSGEQRIYVSLTGLNENFEKGLSLFENLLSDVKPDDVVLKNMVDDILKKRADSKLNKDVIFREALTNYGKYGPKNPFNEVVPESELNQLQGLALTSMIKKLCRFNMRVLYYGPMELNGVKLLMEKYHDMNPAESTPAMKEYPVSLEGRKVYVVDYDLKQAEIMMLAKGETYDPANTAEYSLYNEYFGGGMSSIVFQELRESKALAYSTYSAFSRPEKNGQNYINMAYIGTQSDKLPEAMSGMMNLLTDMPRSDVQFNAAKASLDQRLRTERSNKSGILFDYYAANKLGLKENISAKIFEKVQNMELKDVAEFQNSKVKNLSYTTLVMGNKSELNLKELEKYGEVQFLTMEEIFGY
jgi:predicted Zn-dependent peptidase